MSFQLNGRPTNLKAGDCIVWNKAKKEIYVMRGMDILSIDEKESVKIDEITPQAFESIAKLITASTGLLFNISEVKNSGNSCYMICRNQGVNY